MRRQHVAGEVADRAQELLGNERVLVAQELHELARERGQVWKQRRPVHDGGVRDQPASLAPRTVR